LHQAGDVRGDKIVSVRRSYHRIDDAVDVLMLPFGMILAVEIFIDRYGTEAGGSTHSDDSTSDDGPCFVAAA
jgi:hypothetical protein